MPGCIILWAVMNIEHPIYYSILWRLNGIQVMMVWYFKLLKKLDMCAWCVRGREQNIKWPIITVKAGSLHYPSCGGSIDIINGMNNKQPLSEWGMKLFLLLMAGWERKAGGVCVMSVCVIGGRQANVVGVCVMVTWLCVCGRQTSMYWHLLNAQYKIRAEQKLCTRALMCVMFELLLYGSQAPGRACVFYGGDDDDNRLINVYLFSPNVLLWYIQYFLPLMASLLCPAQWWEAWQEGRAVSPISLTFIDLFLWWQCVLLWDRTGNLFDLTSHVPWQAEGCPLSGGSRVTVSQWQATNMLILGRHQQVNQATSRTIIQQLWAH